MRIQACEPFPAYRTEMLNGVSLLFLTLALAALKETVGVGTMAQFLENDGAILTREDLIHSASAVTKLL